MILPKHRSETAHLPEQPFHDFGAPAQVGWQKLGGLFRKILQNSPGLENVQRSVAVRRLMIHDGGNAIVRRDREKIRRELFTRSDIHWLDVVGQTGFFQKNCDLMAVRRGPVV
jgi:hypothetical protein